MKILKHVDANESKPFHSLDVPVAKVKLKPFLVRHGVPLYFDKAYFLKVEDKL